MEVDNGKVWPSWPRSSAPIRSVSGLELPPHISAPGPDPPCRRFCRPVQIGEKLARVSQSPRLLGSAVGSSNFSDHPHAPRTWKGQAHTKA